MLAELGCTGKDHLGCSLEVRTETFENIKRDWGKLVAESRCATVFLSPSWQCLWWQDFAGDACLKLLSFRSGETVVGLAPLMAERGVVSFLGGADLVDYHDFLMPRVDGRRFLTSLLAELNRWGQWNTLDLTSLPEWSPALSLLPEIAARKGWRVNVEMEDVAPGISLPGTWDDYLGHLSKKDRHELRRKLRRLNAAGNAEQATHTSPADVDAAFSEFARLHRLSSPEKAAFMTPEREAFMRRAAVKLAAEGVTRLSFLRLDGAPVAASLGFVFGNAQLAYNSGYDPDYRSLSVGLLNHAFSIRQAIEQGVRYYDFMRGNERYKYQLGARDRALHRVVVAR